MNGEGHMNAWNSPGGLAQVLRVTLPLQLMAASSAAYAFVFLRRWHSGRWRERAEQMESARSSCPKAP